MPATNHNSLSIRVVAGCLLLNYLALCCGIPLPQWSSITGKPFPCQSHACGCRTAEQCWRSCCCYTHSQKVAWAKANNVAIPDYVAATNDVAATTEVASVTSKSSASCGNSCCAKSTARSKKKRLEVATCTHETSDVANSSATTQNTESHGWSVLFYLQADQCRGGSASTWLSVPVSLPMSLNTVQIVGEPCLVERVVHTNREAYTSFSEIPTPPPRGV
jgi:hypothetical protein